MIARPLRVHFDPAWSALTANIKLGIIHFFVFEEEWIDENYLAIIDDLHV